MIVLVQALRATVVLTLLTGVLYPLAVLGVATLVASREAEGSLVRDGDGKVVGSMLIGQAWSSPHYVWGRPSCAGAGYDPRATCGSNITPVGAEIVARVAGERERLVAANPDADGPPPVLLLTTSGSGLDPHLSPEAARWQAPRVARARGIERASVEALVDELTEGRTLGVLGEPVVNVLRLNLELDRRYPLVR